MKNFMKYLTVAALLGATFLFWGCVAEERPDHRELDYGYVQFKLYKEASFTKSVEIPYLKDVSKIKVNLEYEGTTFSQTLVVAPADNHKSEFGLRSAKLKLLAGDYEILSYVLCDKMDNDIDEYIPAGDMGFFSVVAGGLVSHVLTADVTPRGSVKFTLVKDLSGFGNNPATRSAVREYTFDEIRKVTVEVENTVTHVREKFEKLPAEFSVHFDDDETTDGYQTSSIICDTVLSLKAGE